MAEIRGALSLNIRVEGLNELDAQFARIGKMPKKHLTRAARLGMADPLRQAKANAPIGKNTTTRGTLKKSITKKMETPNNLVRNTPMIFLKKVVKVNSAVKIRLIILIRSNMALKENTAVHRASILWRKLFRNTNKLLCRKLLIALKNQ